MRIVWVVSVFVLVIVSFGCAVTFPETKKAAAEQQWTEDGFYADVLSINQEIALVESSNGRRTVVFDPYPDGALHPGDKVYVGVLPYCTPGITRMVNQ
jgi:hypothetical protein